MRMTLIVLLFIGCALLPLLPGLLVLRRRSDAEPLLVRADSSRDPRYFGANWRQHHAREPGGLARGPWPERAPAARPAGGDLGELYLRAGGHVGDGQRMQVLVADAGLELGSGVQVGRFVDAEGDLTVGPDADLGTSAASGATLLLSEGARFQRLYGQPLRVRAAGPPDAASPAGLNLPTARPGALRPPELGDEVVWGRGELRLPAGLRLDRDLVAYSDVHLGPGVHLCGDLKAHGSVHLHPGARVDGNIVARRDVVLHGGNEVLGQIHAERSVTVGPECRVGQAGASVTVYAAGHIQLQASAEIWGHVVAERGGQVPHVAPELPHAAD